MVPTFLRHAQDRPSDSARSARLASQVRAGFGSLAYQNTEKRDLRIDFLRGFAVLAMVVDHVAGPSVFYALTGGNRFFTSAAEGFVFVSGLMIGLVYGQTARRQGTGAAVRRLLARAWQLYLLAVGLTLVMLPVSELLHLPWAQGVDLRSPLGVALSIITLHQTYYLVDIPLLYALLLLAAPLALFLMCEGRTRTVVFVSWALWGGYQFLPERLDLPWPIAGNYLFYVPAWQVLFFTAMALGFHRDRLAALVPHAWYRPLLVASGMGFGLLLVLFHYTNPILEAIVAASASGDPASAAGPAPSAQLVLFLFGKGDVRPGRIVASAVVFAFLFLLTSELWVPLRRTLGWLLLPLGKNALFAYSAHVVLAVLLGVATTAGVVGRGSYWSNAGIQALGIAAIWLAIRYRVCYPTPANRHLWMRAPAALAVLFLLIPPIGPPPDLTPAEPPPQPVVAASARVARVFGTPIPRNARPPAPAASIAEARRVTVQPTPAPSAGRVAGVSNDGAPPITEGGQPSSDRPAGDLLPGEVVESPYVGPLRGTLRELMFHSAALDRDMPYYVYLPPRYGTTTRRYPVLYMLHGMSGDKDEWPAYGLIDTVDAMIAARELRPFIVVVPQGDFGYWVNNVGSGADIDASPVTPAGGPRWGDYVTFDLVRHVDANFRTLAEARHRAVGGHSMGGFGALSLAFTHPDVFGVAGAHSPSLREGDGSVPLLGTGEEYAQRDPISLAQSAPNLDQVAIWIDVGEEDPWLERAELLHAKLAERELPHDWNVLPGGHEGAYWKGNLPTYLRFYDRALH